ncbi:hypothetical protein ISN45_Aa05g001210 [Arabidopsis thaliana x Arabidopsis arenosa]|uniref:Protein XRI1 n=1 Tax=Arabidopsis thaliana x Arabidopsis arenosa TaxID=1240361 RepID=A0A8T1ZIA7_9BRAS|nr:hypothetical protein ISN45_Aa05g001210 [Arabidopsis thaliana x Arabidopsis arenosa]
MSELLYSLPTWDHHNLGSLFKPDFNLDACGFMNGSPEQSFRSPEMDYSDVSTGYLEDAIIESGERSKRRRLLFEDPSKSLKDNSQNDWGLHESYSCLNSQFVTPHVNKDERKIGVSYFEEPISTVYESPDTSVSSGEIFVREKTLTEPSSSNCGNYKNKRLITKLVYPFGLVKPGGRENDVTLNDINERILMAPSRPVRHPVGDFASRPCVSGSGPGLSGKAVVALTKIQTQGKGTITIIRTKG